ncbi:hypothetical protein CQ018_11495 [Arthrobacter sp. MYb227]|uniref:bifunctional lysylphosphatidylglycerol flippase/synthetase MprF n=1 Tax=Arthrobacter sp. MYb227 TaxID=1848601 RepID=UPI000CFB01E7|nr:DUF2156 domain-containing protein [Arthrobacter sp. MYb227]PQZ92142.1 hypothetical protein CQ018_11495 [Arthrobacter sp. MYb227]
MNERPHAQQGNQPSTPDTSPPLEPPSRATAWVSAALTIAKRVPFTIGLAVLILAAGMFSGSLFHTVNNDKWFTNLAFGVPAYSNGDWLTAITGTFILSEPASFLATLILLPLGVGWLETIRGTRTAGITFALGQLTAIMVTAGILVLFRGLGSSWIDSLASDLDTGPTGGIFACLTLAVCTLRQPWKLRWQVMLVAFAVVSVTLFGEVSDLGHATAITAVLLYQIRSLSKPELREQRFMAAVALLALVGIQILTIIIPTNGPFGPTHAGGGRLAVLIDAILALILARGLRSGRRIAWIGALILAVLNVLRGVLGITLIVTIGPQIHDPQFHRGAGIASLAAAVAGLWLLMLIYLLVCWRAFRVRRTRHLPSNTGTPALPAARVLTQLQTYGGGTLSWMSTWSGNQHFATSGGSLQTYQVHAGCAIGLSDPIGPAADRTPAMHQFALTAEHAGLIPCFFSTAAPLNDTSGHWRAMQIAEDTIVDLPGLEFTGKKWQDIRTAVNRAKREDIEFRMSLLVDEPVEIRRQLNDISAQWVGDKSLPQIGFTLGTLDEAADPQVKLALALNNVGEVQGFLSWLPVYAPGGAIIGWTLDLMRRAEGSFGPVMEFLLGSSLKYFSALGADFASLSGAPLARSTPTAAQQPVDRVLGTMAHILEPLYGFGSLHAFKAKFNPRITPMYLVYLDEADLPRLAAGLTRAFLPDATMGQLAREGFSAIRDVRAAKK